jgi:hypothetical protein
VPKPWRVPNVKWFSTYPCCNWALIPTHHPPQPPQQQQMEHLCAETRQNVALIQVFTVPIIITLPQHVFQTNFKINSKCGLIRVMQKRVVIHTITKINKPHFCSSTYMSQVLTRYRSTYTRNKYKIIYNINLCERNRIWSLEIQNSTLNGGKNRT